MPKQSKPVNDAARYAPVMVLVGAVLFVIFAIFPNYTSLMPSRGAPPVIATLDPQIISNLTALPNMQPPNGEAAQQLQDLQTQVDACADFSDERRAHMSQHIRWLLNPSTIPPDILIAAGVNPLNRLVFGMAVYTSSEWRLLDRPADSCLIAIGRTLNDMLSAAGEPPLTIYDE